MARNPHSQQKEGEEQVTEKQIVNNDDVYVHNPTICLQVLESEDSKVVRGQIHPGHAFQPSEVQSAWWPRTLPPGWPRQHPLLVLSQQRLPVHVGNCARAQACGLGVRVQDAQGLQRESKAPHYQVGESKFRLLLAGVQEVLQTKVVRALALRGCTLTDSSAVYHISFVLEGNYTRNIY